MEVSSPGKPRHLETTLLDLVSKLWDTFEDDEQTVRLVAQLIQKGRIRTSEGFELRLSSR